MRLLFRADRNLNHRGGAVLNGSRVAGSTLIGQTQNREPHHADVRFDVSRFTKATRSPATAPRAARRIAGRERAEVLYSSGSVVNCSG